MSMQARSRFSIKSALANHCAFSVTFLSKCRRDQIKIFASNKMYLCVQHLHICTLFISGFKCNVTQSFRINENYDLNRINGNWNSVGQPWHSHFLVPHKIHYYLHGTLHFKCMSIVYIYVVISAYVITHHLIVGRRLLCARISNRDW